MISTWEARLRQAGWVALVAAIVAFHGWTLGTTGGLPRVGPEQEDYYNMLAHGFLDGYTSLKTTVPEALIHADDPYDPAKRPPGVGLHDASYFRGKYYLYFGVTPVAVLLVPFRVLTGVDLPMALADWFFVCAGTVALIWVYLDARRRYFPESNAWLGGLSVLALGVCGMALSLLRRTSIWELPIAAGYAFAMAGLALLYAGLHRQRRRRWWALAGLSLGLAVGARPDMVAGAGVFAVIGFWLLASPPVDGRRSWSTIIGECSWLGGSFAVVIAGLLAYNHARFGRWLEFGLNFQLTGMVEAKVKHFQTGFMGFNAYLYYLLPAEWSPYFPYLQVGRTPVPPAGYYGSEYVYGLLVNLPVTLLALFWPCGLTNRGVGEGRRLGFWLAGATVWFAGIGVLLLGFVTAAQRYMVDFAPTLVLLGCFGALGIEHWLDESARWVRATVVAVVGALTAFSVFFAVMASFQYHGLFQTFSPRTYEKVAHALDEIPWAWDRLSGVHYGPVEMVVRFPENKTAQNEPLLTTGYAFFSDHLFVRYHNDHQIRLGFDHVNGNAWWSAPIDIDFREPHRLRIEMGSLYPPEWHPFFDGMAEPLKQRLSHTLRVEVDGKRVLDAEQAFHPGSRGALSVGGGHALAPYGKAFSGQVLSLRRLPPDPTRKVEGLFGARTLRTVFERAPAGALVPLLCTGRGAEGDLLYVRQVREGVIRFGYEDTGTAPIESDELSIEYNRVYSILVQMPSLLDPASPPSVPIPPTLQVRLDDSVVWGAPVTFHPAEAAGIAVGENRCGNPRCGERFAGRITAVSIDEDVLNGKTDAANTLGLAVRFPTDRTGRSDPLVVWGVSGRADVVLVRYAGPDTIVLAVDHWGYGLAESRPIHCDYRETQSLHFQFCAAARSDDPRREIVVTMDGLEVWRTLLPFYGDPNVPGAFGMNLIGASSCGEYFGGTVIRTEIPVQPSAARSK